MSSGEPIPYVQAARLAETLRVALRPACERLEIAGSIRRRKPTVSDIELVAIPLMVTEPGGDLWNETVTERSLLDERIESLADLHPRLVTLHRADGSEEVAYRNGASYKALEWAGVPVDLFIVRPPAEWGVIFTIRTGPADFSHRLVTDCQRFGRQVKGGRLLVHGRPVPCPEERDFLQQIGQAWLEPMDRVPEAVRLSWSVTS